MFVVVDFFVFFFIVYLGECVVQCWRFEVWGFFVFCSVDFSFRRGFCIYCVFYMCWLDIWTWSKEFVLDGFTCIYMYIEIRVCSVFVCIRLCLYTCIDISFYTYAFKYYVYIFEYMCVCACYVCVCVYRYVYRSLCVRFIYLFWVLVVRERLEEVFCWFLGGVVFFI